MQRLIEISYSILYIISFISYNILYIISLFSHSSNTHFKIVPIIIKQQKAPNKDIFINLMSSVKHEHSLCRKIVYPSYMHDV